MYVLEEEVGEDKGGCARVEDWGKWGGGLVHVLVEWEEGDIKPVWVMDSTEPSTKAAVEYSVWKRKVAMLTFRKKLLSITSASNRAVSAKRAALVT